jgi:hypothetical protein
MSKKVVFLKTAMAVAVTTATFQAGAATLFPSGTTSGPMAMSATPRKVASASAALDTVNAGNVNFQTNTPSGIVVNQPSVIEVYFRLAGGATWNNADTSLYGAATSVGTGISPQMVTATDISTDQTTLRLRFNVTAASTSIGVGANFTLTIAAGAGIVSGTTTPLATPGTTVQVQSSFNVVPMQTATVPNASVALPSNIASEPTVSANYVQSALGANCTATASQDGRGAMGADPVNVNVLVTGVTNGKVLTAGGFVGAADTRTVNFGTVTCTNDATVVLADGVSAYTINGPSAHRLRLSATGSFAAVDPGVGAPASNIFLSENQDCSMPVAASTATLNMAKTTATFGAFQPTSGTPYHVCMVTDANVTAIPETTPVISGAVRRGTTTTAPIAASLAASNLYALLNNGSLIDVRYYIPNSVLAGPANVLRLVNTGTLNVAANGIRTQWLPADGSAATATCTLPSALAAGASLNIEALAIEAACPLPAGVTTAASTWPRLRVVAPATDLTAQYYVLVGNTFVNLSAAQQSGQKQTRVGSK